MKIHFLLVQKLHRLKLVLFMYMKIIHLIIIYCKFHSYCIYLIFNFYFLLLLLLFIKRILRNIFFYNNLNVLYIIQIYYHSTISATSLGGEAEPGSLIIYKYQINQTNEEFNPLFCM